MKDSIGHKSKWTIRRFRNRDEYLDWVEGKAEPVEESVVDGNVLLNEGITALQNLLIGGAEDAFNNTNSYLGVGNDATVAAATDTGLIGTHAYQGMEATYPLISGQATTWRSVFDGDTANFDWREFTVSSGSTNAADNLNRAVDTQGTKALGQTWTLDLEITWS